MKNKKQPTKNKHPRIGAYATVSGVTVTVSPYTTKDGLSIYALKEQIEARKLIDRDTLQAYGYPIRSCKGCVYYLEKVNPDSFVRNHAIEGETPFTCLAIPETFFNIKNFDNPTPQTPVCPYFRITQFDFKVWMVEHQAINT